jgi:hypothetical protein
MGILIYSPDILKEGWQLLSDLLKNGLRFFLELSHSSLLESIFQIRPFFYLVFIGR